MRPVTGSVTPSGNRYRARVTIAGRRVNLGTAPTEDEAWELIEAALQATQAGEVASSKDATLRSIGGPWLLQRERSDIGDARGEERRWKRHVLGHAIADRPVRALTQSDIESWLADVVKATSRETANRCLSLLRGCLQSAIPRHIKDSPARAARLPGRRVKAKRWSYWEPSEQAQVLTSPAVPEIDRLVIGFALGTGIRQGELVALQWPEVHLSGRYPYVDITRSRKRDVTKGGKPRRVPLFGVGLASIKRWRELHPGAKGLVFPSPTGKMRSAGHPLGQIDQVTERDGRKVRRKVCRWPMLLELSGVRRIRWHDLRHTCASSLVSGWWGPPWPLEQVAELLGDTMAAAAIYAHLGESSLRAAADRTGWLRTVSIGPAPTLPPHVSEPNQAVGQEGLEPSTDGLKVPWAPEAIRALRPASGQNRAETLAARLLVAMAQGAPEAERLAIELAEAVLSEAVEGQAGTG